MKVSNFVLLGGALTLLVGSLFATKNAKNFKATTTAYAGPPFVGARLIYPDHITSTILPSYTLFLGTSNGRVTLFTSPALLNKAYYKP
ncbi:hypothetical protein GO495_29230 [Chitinophaga oryziterrae]|uniref:Uncharacterized protein n=1 Tax=Chitinophaga oryziterrae TaxID=1031224 RepID=A0A6N8JKK2_9BACT|nr:hypothetical protein [Chitinophaga oryziterrae]MVT44712.1 hypothetical protein [Chitinophaga oryziterrae]